MWTKNVARIYPKITIAERLKIKTSSLVWLDSYYVNIAFSTHKYFNDQAKYLPYRSRLQISPGFIPGLPFLCILEGFLIWLFLVKDRLKMYWFQISLLCAKKKREQVKFVAPPKDMLHLFSFVRFWLNMTSGNESNILA